MYTINIYKFTLLKVGKRKKKYFELLESYKHINAKEVSKKSLELSRIYNGWNSYIDIVDEKTKNEMIKKGMN
jgi:hypothetical protein